MLIRSAVGGPVALASLVLACSGQASGAVVLGQVDTFTSGTSAFWSGGPGPLVIDGGGPAGAGDRYLEMTADGAGSGGKLSMYNREQWLGDYIGQGITAVEMDLKNFTTGPLSMRIAFKTGSGPTAPGYAYTVPFVVPADGQWHHAAFVLEASRFTAIGGPVAFDSVLSGIAQEFRVLHSTSPSLTGTTIIGRFGADNIAAVPGPAGATTLLGAGAFMTARRRRTTRPVTSPAP